MNQALVNKLRGDTIPLDQQYATAVGGYDYTTGEFHPLAVDGVGQLVISVMPIGATLDYGTSAGALRTAAQIGNTTGQADFDSGVAGAQTLRTVSSTTERVLAKTTVSANGSVAAGAQSVTFITGTTFSGTIAGDAVGSNTTIAISANGNDTIGAINYTRAAGSMQIITLT